MQSNWQHHTDDDIAEMYRRSLLNPSRFTLWFQGWLDCVTPGGFVLCLGVVTLVWWVFA